MCKGGSGKGGGLQGYEEEEDEEEKEGEMKKQSGHERCRETDGFPNMVVAHEGQEVRHLQEQCQCWDTHIAAWGVLRPGPGGGSAQTAGEAPQILCAVAPVFTSRGLQRNKDSELQFPWKPGGHQITSDYPTENPLR